MEKNKKRKKIACILAFMFLAFAIYKSYEKIMAFTSECYNFALHKLDETWFVAVIICVCAVLCILLCWIVAKVIDRFRKYPAGCSLADKHPVINLIIGLLMIVIMGAMAWTILFYLLKYIGEGIAGLIGRIKDIASKMDAVVIVALITGMVSIVGVIISSIVAKIIDYKKSRQEYLAKKREEPYGEFVEMIYKIQQNAKKKNSYTEEMMLNDLAKFSKQITLWGSSRVVSKWVKFRENGANPEAGTDNLFLMEKIMNEMRKDLGLKKVRKGNLLAFFVNDIKKVMKR